MNKLTEQYETELNYFLSQLLLSNTQPQRLSREAARTIDLMTMEYEESEQQKTLVDFKKFSSSFEVRTSEPTLPLS